MSEKRKRGFSIKPEGLALIEQTMEEKGYSRQQLADAVAELEGYLSIDTINRLLRGEKTQRKTIKAIAKALDLAVTDLVEQSEWFPASSTAAQEKTAASEINIDWREVCHAMLKEQQDKQRLRRQATEMGFEVNVHVPLGLVQRKQQQRRDEDVELNQLYQLDREVIAKTYQHDEFLTQVIGQRQARKNKNIAIVGEPGAGKTTLLGAIASFIQSNTEDLPICITLASLQGRTLEDYLLKTWLEEAMGLVNPDVVVTPEIKDELIRQFRKGGVWLLLDGVDEMGADSPVQALTTIQQQLTEWIGQVRVVLACRVNVWDTSVNNTLTGFDTYRTQEFTHKQIYQFIQEWFTCAEDAQRGEQLKAKLKETGRERIRELVKNPLRLALLCQIFYVDKQGELPETKAALYGRFTRYFYEWKQNLHPKNLINQDELHQALGKLALAGINSKARFRLRQSLACHEMGGRLFKLACDLGWLNLVDRDAKTDEPVYAFFHANFQEYFAALTIDDWHYLLNHVPHNPEEGIYRIFEPQWKEVFLLWLGREDLPKAGKEEFLIELGTFDEKCDDSLYYWERATLLITRGIAEFRDVSFADVILEYTVSLVVGNSNEEDDREDPVIQAAWAALKESDRSRVIPALLNLLGNSQDKDICLPAIRRLGEIADGNPEAMTALTELLQNSQDENILLEAIKSLEKTGFGNSEVITSLTELLQNSQNKNIILEAAKSLETIDPGNSEAILTQEREYVRSFLRAKFGLGCIKTNVRPILMDLLQTSRDNAIKDLTKLIQTTQDTDIICEAANCLGRIGSGNLDAIIALEKLLRNNQNQDIRIQAACSLMKIDPDNSEATTTLVKEVRTHPYKIHSLEFLFCEASNANVVRVLVELLQAIPFKDLNAIYVLGEIGYGCSEAITGLVQILRNSKDKNVCCDAIISLRKIAFGHPEAITTLIEVLRTSQDESYYWEAIYSLGEIAFNHPEAIKVLIEILYKRKDGFTRLVAESLSKISAGNLEAVTALLALQRTGVDIGENALWYCSQNTPYPDFYRAWHSQPSTTHPEAHDNIPIGDSPTAQALEPQFTDIASQLHPANKTYPIVINTQALEGETDTSAIAQALCNRIYRAAFGDDSDIPPEVSNAYQLERLIPHMKKQLQKQNLALILDKCQPNQAQVTFCRKLTDVLHIAWITNEPLEPPLKGFPPDQPNLLSAIQSWIDEIG